MQFSHQLTERWVIWINYSSWKSGIMCTCFITMLAWCQCYFEPRVENCSTNIYKIALAQNESQQQFSRQWHFISILSANFIFCSFVVVFPLIIWVRFFLCAQFDLSSINILIYCKHTHGYVHFHLNGNRLYVKCVWHHTDFIVSFCREFW